MRLRVDDDLRRSRVTVFFRLLLVVPHLVWLYVWGFAFAAAVAFNWFATLFSGRSEDDVRQGRFREDLFYRLNVLPIVLPPLRARAEDIPQLVAYYVDMYNREFKKHVVGVTTEAMQQLRRHAWPGNVRELRNAIERAMLLTEEDRLTAEDFTGNTAAPVRLSDGVVLPGGGVDLEQLERSLVVQALERTGWNQTRAATLLGLNRDQIRYRIEKFQLEKNGAGLSPRPTAE